MERMSKSNLLKNVRQLMYIEFINKMGLSCKKLNVARGGPFEQPICLIGRE
jgi:hypothetical protein